MCRLMLSVQTGSVPVVWAPNFNRDGNFISRNNRLSRFEVLSVGAVSYLVNTPFGQHTEGLVQSPPEYHGTQAQGPGYESMMLYGFAHLPYRT